MQKRAEHLGTRYWYNACLQPQQIHCVYVHTSRYRIWIARMGLLGSGGWLFVQAPMTGETGKSRIQLSEQLMVSYWMDSFSGYTCVYSSVLSFAFEYEHETAAWVLFFFFGLCWSAQPAIHIGTDILCAGTMRSISVLNSPGDMKLQLLSI